MFSLGVNHCGYVLNGECNHVEWCHYAGPISWILGVVIAEEICGFSLPYAPRQIVVRFGEGPQRN